MSKDEITFPYFDSVAYLKKGLMDKDNMSLSCLYAGCVSGKSNIMRELYLECYKELHDLQSSPPLLEEVPDE